MAHHCNTCCDNEFSDGADLFARATSLGVPATGRCRPPSRGRHARAAREAAPRGERDRPAEPLAIAPRPGRAPPPAPVLRGSSGEPLAVGRGGEGRTVRDEAPPPFDDAQRERRAVARAREEAPSGAAADERAGLPAGRAPAGSTYQRTSGSPRKVVHAPPIGFAARTSRSIAAAGSLQSMRRWSAATRGQVRPPSGCGTGRACPPAIASSARPSARAPASASFSASVPEVSRGPSRTGSSSMSGPPSIALVRT